MVRRMTAILPLAAISRTGGVLKESLARSRSEAGAGWKSRREQEVRGQEQEVSWLSARGVSS